ncbi:hypothetical protein KSP39_PZI012804 [Platanthera zijinensis]|uniref:Retroviral polymerase SH3-like domain-containing protein n=1 Tax=Platanthera zijinensis TaxID=2320716 RepID=A0AAP0G539_9ASPA
MFLPYARISQFLQSAISLTACPPLFSIFKLLLPFFFPPHPHLQSLVFLAAFSIFSTLAHLLTSLPHVPQSMSVGYSSTQKGYVCHSPTDQKIVISADVTFLGDLSYHSQSFDPPLPLPSPPLRPAVLVTSPLPPLLAMPLLTQPPKPPLIRVYTRYPSPSDAPSPSPSTNDIMCSNDLNTPSTAHPITNYISLHRLSLNSGDLFFLYLFCLPLTLYKRLSNIWGGGGYGGGAGGYEGGNVCSLGKPNLRSCPSSS